MNINQLAEQRQSSARSLQEFLPLDSTVHRERNAALFASVISQAPPINDPSWGQIAFVAANYAKNLASMSLTHEQKSSMWTVLLWAFWYERHFRAHKILFWMGAFVPFLPHIAGEQQLLDQAMPDLIRVVEEFDSVALIKLQESLSREDSPLQLDSVRAIVTKRLADQSQAAPEHGREDFIKKDLPEIAPIRDAILLLWEFLNPKHVVRDKPEFNQACQNPGESVSIRCFIRLAGIISQNVITRNDFGTRLPDEKIKAARTLAEYVVPRMSAEPAKQAQVIELLLATLDGMRQRTLDTESFCAQLDEKVDESIAKHLWSNLAYLVTNELSKRRQANAIDLLDSEAWVRSFARHIDLIEKKALELFLVEIAKQEVRDSVALARLKSSTQPDEVKEQSAGPLDFLEPGKRDELNRAALDSRLDGVVHLLRNVRPKLLASLSRGLADPQFQQQLPPRRNLVIRRDRRDDDRFPEARTLLRSSNATDRTRALRIFEDGVACNTHEESRRLAHEWKLYAQAIVMGPASVISEWERDRKLWEKNPRALNQSWEVLWNLAAFYIKNGRPGQALEVLRPGVDALIAPYSHLRFGLYCSVQILERLQHTPLGEIETSRKFVIEHLSKLPLAECYLAWLLVVDESKESVDFIQQASILGLFARILTSPVEALRPEAEHDDQQIERFGNALRDLNSEATWRLWINDYAERHPYHLKAWYLLSEASERSGDLERAQQALQEIVEIQVFQLERAKPENQRRIRYLTRSNLVRLFEFCRRSNRSQEAKALFERYFNIRALNPLWDSTDLSNNLLISLTRDYYEPKKQVSPKEIGITGNQWLNLNTDLSTVKDIPKLRSLQRQLEVAFESIPVGQTIIRDRTAFIKLLLSSFLTLDVTNRSHSELQKETSRINKATVDASKFVEAEVALKPLKPLITTFQRCLESFNDAQALAPVPQIDTLPLGAGLPDDLSETSLLVRITNPGPGDLLNIRIGCRDGETLGSRREITVPKIQEQTEEVVAIPVTVLNSGLAREIGLHIHVNYQWGVLTGLSAKQAMVAPLFSFGSFLQEHGISAHEIPNPYVFDSEINFELHDHRLFQGRESEIQLVRSTLMQARPTGSPIYFHGVRKVGKTSLLNRIALELKAGEFAPVVVKLLGLDVSLQSLEIIINNLTNWILRDSRRQGISTEGLSAIPVDHINPLSELEPFFESLRARTGSKRLILLLDEFHGMVGDKTAPLLDLLRRVYQDGLVWFILCGSVRHEPLRKSCLRSSLFPLMHRAVDFLPQGDVARAVRAPLEDFGVSIPDATIRTVYSQTAGNPYQVAKITWHGVERLNSEHRNVLAPQDIEEIAKRLADDPANFTSSSFSPLILTPAEQDAAVRFAKALGDLESMPIQQALRDFGDIMQDLEEKQILKKTGDGLGIQGKLLATFLRSRIQGPPPPPPPQDGSHRKVGIFVDIENLLPVLPAGMTPKDAALRLAKFAAQFGRVVCRWACAHEGNFRNPIGIRLEFEGAGFTFRPPQVESIRPGTSKKDLADFVLLRCIDEESEHTQPDTYIIVSGDKGYYEKIDWLLKQGFAVRIISHENSDGNRNALFGGYRDLEIKRRRERIMGGFTDSDFFIDEIHRVLS